MRSGWGLFSAVLVAMAACHPQASPAAAPPRSEPAPDDSGGDIADPNDRCPWILEGCAETDEDGDGCPDVSLEIKDCKLGPSDDHWLQEVTAELQKKRGLGRIRVVSGMPACAEAVRVALVGRGIEASRLETKTAENRAADVSFQVAAWKGRKCP